MSAQELGGEARKRTASGRVSNPLAHLGILEGVLSYLQGEGLFIRAVSTVWEKCYERAASLGGSGAHHVHSCRCTSYKAVFASASRLREGQQSGFQRSRTGERRWWWCAGTYADIETLELLQRCHGRFEAALLEGAAESNDLSKLQWLHLEGHAFPANVTALVARGGGVETLKWLRQTGCAFSRQTMYYAAQKPHNMPTLQYLCDAGCRMSDSACEAAAAAGDLEQLTWLHARGARWNTDIARSAASGGSVQVFRWLQQQGVALSEGAMTLAANYGHLELCQFLHAEQVPLTELACNYAVEAGQVDTVRWLRANGCSWTVGQVRLAAVIAPRNTAEMLQYVQEQGLLDSAEDMTRMLKYALEYKHSAAAQWLRQQGALEPEGLYERVSHLSANMVILKGMRSICLCSIT